MTKEWIVGRKGRNLKFKRETLLNYGVSRWGLNKSHSVGTTSELIRRCAPKTYKVWEQFYFENAKEKKQNGIKISRKHLKTLGHTLYLKLSEKVHNELTSIKEKECVDYIFNLVLNRTYEGYLTEIETIYGQLESLLGTKIESAPDNWDRTYNVDFFIKINSKFIGLQIKPISSGQPLNQYQWIEMHKRNHERFQKKFGGKVFFIYSIKSIGGKKRIFNIDVIEEIKKEMRKLKKSKPGV